MSKFVGIIIGLTEIGVGVATGNVGLIAAGVTTTVGGIALALQKAPRPEQTETALKSPTPPRVSGYGENRIAMAYALYVTASDGSAVDVGVFHAGRVDAITAHYLGDVKVQLTGGGYVIGQDDGQFGENDDNVKVGTTLGPDANTAFADVIAKVPDQWTANHRGDGQVTGFAIWKAVKTANFAKIYPGGGPNNNGALSLAMRLQLVYDWRDPTQVLTDPTTWKWSENAWQ